MSHLRLFSVQFRRVRPILLVYAVLVALTNPAPASARGGVINRDLVNPMPATANVNYYQVSPDEQTVVFNADLAIPNMDELYRVPTHGGAYTKINNTLVNGGSVWWDFKTALNSASGAQYVVYRATYALSDGRQLFSLHSAPLAGGSPITLYLPSEYDRTVDAFWISPDGQTVVLRTSYSRGTSSASPSDLYSVPIAGGADPVRLNGTTSMERVIYGVEIAPDSSRVIFSICQVCSTANEPIALYSIPLAGGVSPTRLSGTLDPGEDGVGSFLISPKIDRVVFKADRRVAHQAELFSAPIDGLTDEPIQLNPNLVAGGSIVDFKLVYDSLLHQHVVYLADQQTPDRVELYRGSITTQGATRISLDITAAGGSVQSDFAISPNGNWVVYRANPTDLNVTNLYKIGIEGGNFRQVSPAIAINGRQVDSFRITPNNLGIIYYSGHAADGVDQLYFDWLTPVVSNPLQLTHFPSTPHALVTNYQITPNNGAVVYTADQETDGIFETFSVNLQGLGTVKWNIPFQQSLGGVNSITLLSDNASLVYRADVWSNERYGLFYAYYGFQNWLPLTRND